MPDSFDYTTGTNSENVRLLQALIDDAPEYTEETNSRNANILKSIINNTEYTDAPQSEIEELLLRLKAKIGGEIEVDELNVTENGTYDAGVNKAYNPVKVELPLDSKTITENGTYTASDDNLAGYDEVTVAVEGYAKKSIPNTPTPIATFNASALPMPSLTVGIEAQQAGTGDPSPTNVRPISGWSAVNRYRTGKNLVEETLSGMSIGSTGYIVANSSFDLQIFKVIKGVTYTITTNENYFVGGFYEEKPDINSQTYDQSRITDGSKTFVAPITGYGLFRTSSDYDTPQCEFGSTATSYTAYNGTTYTTQLKDRQGNPLTCYGGELSNDNGVQSLDNTHNSFDMGGVGWGYTNNRFFAKIDDIWNNEQSRVPTENQLMCEIYKTAMYTNQPSGTVSTWSGYIYIRDDSYNGDATAFKTAVTGYKIAYELATPQTIPQDNLSIATQDGTNNMWADTGDVIEGSYFSKL